MLGTCSVKYLLNDLFLSGSSSVKYLVDRSGDIGSLYSEEDLLDPQRVEASSMYCVQRLRGGGREVSRDLPLLRKQPSPNNGQTTSPASWRTSSGTPASSGTTIRASGSQGLPNKLPLSRVRVMYVGKAYVFIGLNLVLLSCEVSLGVWRHDGLDQFILGHRRLSSRQQAWAEAH